MKYNKVVYVITNTNGGIHTELKEGYLILSKNRRFYGVSGQHGAWYITDILTGCLVGKCEKLSQVAENVAPKEAEIERLINETDTFNSIIAEVYKTYIFTRIRWFNDLFNRERATK